MYVFRCLSVILLLSCVLFRLVFEFIISFLRPLLFYDLCFMTVGYFLSMLFSLCVYYYICGLTLLWRLITFSLCSSYALLQNFMVFNTTIFIIIIVIIIIQILMSVRFSIISSKCSLFRLILIGDAIVVVDVLIKLCVVAFAVVLTLVVFMCGILF